jgi:hypothetical protein
MSLRPPECLENVSASRTRAGTGAGTSSQVVILSGPMRRAGKSRAGRHLGQLLPQGWRCHGTPLCGGARSTKDVDIGVAGERAEHLQNFRNGLALGFDEFSFQLKGKPLSLYNADAVRLEPGVLYRTRPWQTIDVDLGPAGSGAVDLVKPTIPGLSAMGLRIPSPVRCLNLSE